MSIKCSRTFQLVKCPDIDLVSPSVLMGLMAVSEVSEVFSLNILPDLSKVAQCSLKISGSGLAAGLKDVTLCSGETIKNVVITPLCLLSEYSPHSSVET